MRALNKTFKRLLIGQFESVAKVLAGYEQNTSEKQAHDLSNKNTSREKSICLSRQLRYLGQAIP